ncbi:hypothetical protein [Burkholderia cenocepacia]|uniref:hypothetical protein n=1 Tax=Burkholderia cenocepacia TaxID=95486 RepID=UPI00265288B2|nr:hypothetical protein [Burkholderia cenocepacia]MDN7630975.1 hypothetical protein [Burkholderia cenocepacia]
MNPTVRFVLASAVIMFSRGALSADLPNPSLTPGAIDSNVTQANIHETICLKGYTKSIRPPAYFTNALKRRQIREYGYVDRNPRDYEEDHLVALSIGGHPTDERNLWPQPRDSEWNADRKDELEFVLYKMVCGSELSLKDAQSEMAGDWIAAWKRYVPSHPFYRYKKVD